MRGLQARLVGLPERGCRHELADRTAAGMGNAAAHSTRGVFPFQRGQCGLRLAFAAARAAELGRLALTSTTRRRTLTSGIALHITAVHSTRADFARGIAVSTGSTTTSTTTLCSPVLTCCSSTSTTITIAGAGRGNEGANAANVSGDRGSQGSDSARRQAAVGVRHAGPASRPSAFS